MSKQLKSVNRYLTYSAAIIAVIILIILIGKITTHLVKKVLISTLSSKLDKKVVIDGDFIINYSLSPSLQISDLKFINKNIESDQSEFARIGNAFVKVEIFPLISKKIYIDEINISDVFIYLEKDKNGNPNWELPPGELTPHVDENKPINLPGDIALNQLNITNVLISFNNLETGNKENLNINNVLISLPKNSNLKANLIGSYLENPVELKLSGGSYKEIKDSILPWQFDFYGNLTANEIHASGNINNLLNQGDLDLNLKLSTTDFDLEPVFYILSNVYKNSLANYKGSIGELNLDALNLNKDLIKTIKLSSINLLVSKLNVLKLNPKNGKFVKFLNINSGKINLNEDDKSKLNILGSLVNIPLNINADGCNRSEYLNNSNDCKFNINAAHGNSDFNVKGSIKLIENEFAFNIQTKFTTPDIHQYDYLFDVPKSVVIPAKASFVFVKNKRDISVSDINFKLGESDLNGKIEKVFINNRPNYNIFLNSKALNLNEIMSVLPKHDDDQDSDHSLKLRIFPNNLSIYDATTKIDLKNVTYHNLVINKFFVNSRIKDNIETSSEFMVLTEDGDFKGIYDLNLAPELPVAKFKIKSKNIDIGKFVHDVGFAENVNFKTKNLDLELNIVGSTLEEILLNSTLKADSKNGEYIVKDINTDSSFEIFVNSAHLELFAHKPIVIRFDGSINEQPVKIKLEAEHIIRSISAIERGKIPIKLKLEFSETKVIVEGFAIFPLDRKTSEILITAEGKKLSDFNLLFDVDLPDKGPYRLTTNLNVTDQGYNLANFDFIYADTELTGLLNIVTSGQKPFFDIKINSEVLDIDDFFSSRIKTITEESRNKHKESSGEPALIPQLDSFDANFDFSIDKIILGGEEIGDFEYKGQIINGELLTDSAILNILGGEAEFDIDIRNIKGELKISFLGYLDNYNYLPIAKMINPESNSEGIMDIVVNVESKGTTFAQLDDNLNGEIGLKILPTLMDASLVNIWALGLFTNLIPKFSQDKKEVPKVNCIIGKFKAKDGILRPDDLKIDTTKVRIDVVGRINLLNQRINLVFTPIAKKTQLINFGIPIRVVGTFEDHHIVTDPYNIGKYVLRYTYSLSTYIFEKISKNYKPEDGSDICNKDIIRTN